MTATVSISEPAVACILLGPLVGGYVQTQQVPPDGAIVLEYFCDGQPCATGLQPISVTNDAGQSVTGTLRVAASDVYQHFIAAWVPDVPFAESSRLTITSPDFHSSEPVQVQVVFRPLQLPYSRLNSVTACVKTVNKGDTYCCPDGFTCDGSCISTVTRTYMQLTVDAAPTISTDTPSFQALQSQYMYRLVLDDGLTSDWQLDIGSLWVSTQQAEYCVALEMEHLVDGARTKTASLCIPHGDDPPLEVRNTPVEELYEWLATATCDTHGLVLPPRDGGPLEVDAAAALEHSLSSLDCEGRTVYASGVDAGTIDSTDGGTDASTSEAGRAVTDDVQTSAASDDASSCACGLASRGRRAGDAWMTLVAAAWLLRSSRRRTMAATGSR